MKKIKDCYKAIISPENLWLAWTKYRAGKRNNPAARGFEHNLEENLLALLTDLKNNSYRHGDYYKFFVFDPKKRLISAPKVLDSVLHRAIYNILYPFFDKIFSPFSFSCREGKGTHRAIAAINRYARQASKNYFCDVWIMHGDIKKCFDSIDHKILLELLKCRVICQKTMNLLREVIDSYFTDNGSCPRGIPLGNLTSQLFINVYLHGLDEFAKGTLRIKKYIRYADDFIVIFNTQKECDDCAIKIRDFLSANLKLSCPPTHLKIRRLSRGANLLGKRFLPFYNKVKNKTLRRNQELFLEQCRKYQLGEISALALNASWQASRGMLKYGNNHNAMNCLLNIVNNYA